MKVFTYNSEHDLRALYYFCDKKLSFVPGFKFVVLKMIRGNIKDYTTAIYPGDTIIKQNGEFRKKVVGEQK